MWIEREISSFIESNQDYIQIVRGPRQCGKSSLILHMDPGFLEISLDDLSLRELAQKDPELFLSQFEGKKLFIDEAQYAPQLFPTLKRRVDLEKRKNLNQRRTIFRLTGSNQILMDRHVKESLAGRASFFDMNTLSVSEILRSKPQQNIQGIIFNGGWPELYGNPGLDAKKFLDDYIHSYIEKDIVLAAGIQKSREFLKFIKLLAGRVGNILNLSSLANESGVDTKTIKDWVSVLERMQVIVLLEPYSANISKRLIKSPKVYFIDSGLACRLQGWASSEPIFTSPQQGPLFENLVFSEIYKMISNHQLGWRMYHWRSREGEEIDFLLEKSPGDFLFIEAKVSPRELKDISSFPEVRKVFAKKVPDLIQCHQQGERILNKNVPVGNLAEFLMRS